MIILKIFLKIYEEDFLTQSMKPAFLLYKSQTQNPPPLPKKTYRTISPIKVSAAAAKSLQSCPTLCDPIDGSPPGPRQSLGFSRQEHWSGLPFSSPMHVYGYLRGSAIPNADTMDVELSYSLISSKIMKKITDFITDMGL